jgi:hypothetical protein
MLANHWVAVEDYPKGYPQLSTWMYTDDIFAHVRRFGLLSNRILLHLQTELTELEKELHKLDDTDASSPTLKFRLGGSENYRGWDSTQQELISKIRMKYVEYGTTYYRSS